MNDTLIDVPKTPRLSGLLGGVSSSFRINPFTGGYLSVRRAEGARLETTDGKRYIDMFMAHGSNVIGHGDRRVREGITSSLECGVLSGYETPIADNVAGILAEVVPSVESVRFAASGSEAVNTALRISRAYTGRDIVLRIDGHFHGGSDYAVYNQLAKSADHENPGGRPSRRIVTSGGIPTVVAETIVPVPWNDLVALESAIVEYGDRIAAVILTPIDYNNGCITPAEGYLAKVKQAAHSNGSVLIFDEVLSGFKTGIDCAQGLYGVTPDLTTLSKALSSGMPLSVIAGSAEIMSTILKPGRSGAIQGGTFAGNTPGLAAAKATLDILTEERFYSELLSKAAIFFDDLQAEMQRIGFPAVVQAEGCSFGIYVGAEGPVTDYAEVDALDSELRRRFFAACIEEGVYFHTDFTVSSAHTTEMLTDVVRRMGRAAQRTMPG